MAKVYLDAADTFTVSNSNTTVFGNTGNEVVSIAAGLTGVILDQGVERVVLSGNSSAYTFQQTGNKINVYSGATLVFSTPVQGDANGTQLTFANGTVNTVLSSGVMTLGGVAVPTAAAGPVTPTVVDATVTTPGGNVITTTGQALVLTAGVDNITGTANNDTLTGIISTVATSTTFNTTDTIIDTTTSDSDVFTLTTEADISVDNTGIVRGFETVNVNANATTLGNTALDFEATNFSNVKAYNFDVIKAATVIDTLNVTAMANNNATVTATDKFSTISVAASTGNNATVDAKAVGTSGSATSVTVTGAAGDVTIKGAGYLSATSNANTGLLLVTAPKNLTASGTAAQIISATSTGGNVTISDATASVSTTVNATGDVAISKLDASGKVTVTAGGTITLAGTTAAGTDLNSTSLTLSGVGTSTVGDADLVTSVALSGNGAAATYNMTAGSAALTDVAVSGTSDVTLSLSALSVETTSPLLNVVDTGSGVLTVDLGVAAGDVDLRIGGLVDKLVVSTDNNAKTVSVGSGQAVTYKVDQTATSIVVGSAANTASNTLTVKLDDNVRDNNAVDVNTSLTITQAKTVTIDASVDTTAAGSANTFGIKTLIASGANSNVTINMGANNLGLLAAGATTVGTGTLKVTGSGTLTDAAVTSLTAATLDASAMTGAVTLDSTTTLSVNNIYTGSANDALVLTTSQDQTVQMNGGNDTLTLGGNTYANKAVSIDLGAGTDTLVFVSGTELIKDTSGTVSLAGVETIQFAASGTQSIQASLLTGQTYAVKATGAANTIGVIVGSTDTAVDLSLLAGSAAAESSIAGVTFTTNASANTSGLTIKGMSAAKNAITGSATGSDNITGGAKSDTIAYSSSANLFSGGVLLDTINGGAGTDTISLTGLAAGFTVAATDSWANASNIEKIATTGANANAVSLTLAASAQTAGITTVDLSSTTVASTVNVSAFTSAVTITGSTAADALTGGSGDDTFVAADKATLLLDTIVGGSGTDTISITAGATFAAADSFSKISAVETLKSAAGATATDFTMNADIYAAGIRTLDISAVTAATGNKINVAAITNSAYGVTLVGSATGQSSLTGGSGNDTISGGSADDTITGGAGNDSISLSGGGVDKVVLDTTGYDTITGFTAGPVATIGSDIISGTTSVVLEDAAAIATNDVVVVTAKATEFNLIFAGTGLSNAYDGTALLAALKSVNLVAGVATDVTLTTTAAGVGSFVAYQAGNAYVYNYAAAATGGVADTNISAGDIVLVGIVTGVLPGTLDAHNFA